MQPIHFSLMLMGLLLLCSPGRGQSNGDLASKSSPPDRRGYAKGKQVYQKACLPCHGQRGRGDGALVHADWEVLPRDFSLGVFKYRSTPYGKLPTNQDLERTIRRGIAGTAMPAFHDLRPAEIRAVSEYIKYFAPVWRRPESHDAAITLPAKPASMRTPAGRSEAIAAGRKGFGQFCAPCHGIEGRGDGPASATLLDARDQPIQAANLRESLGCGDAEEDLLRTILTGMSGTPMPSFKDALTPEQAWQLVLWIDSWKKESRP